MKTRPVVAAPAPAESGPAPCERALAQARDVLLAGNQLPDRWAGRSRFVVLATGFGLGDAFLATWDAWRRDPARCERLFFVAIEAQPPTRDTLGRAWAGSPLADLAGELHQAWPRLTPNLHPLSFEHGRVRLLLSWGTPATLLRALNCRADALFLDGDNVANADRWRAKALARLAAPGATAAGRELSAAFGQHLAGAGFEVQQSAPQTDQATVTTACYQPRFSVRAPAPALATESRNAMVVGAGLAGAAVAASLADLGWSVTVFDRQPQPATQASGNPAGLFHGTLHADDGPHARLFRAAALLAERRLRPLIEQKLVPGQIDGLLRLGDGPQALPAMHALIESQGLPADYVQALDTEAASERAGLALAGPCWFYPGGGWLAPAAWVRLALAAEGVRFVGDMSVAALRQHAGGWQLLDAAGRVLGQADTLVLANAEDAQRLLAPLGTEAWPLRRTRGQVSGWRGPRTTLRCPVAGDGYALPWADGGVLCGATVALDDDSAPLRDSDHRHNFERLQRLTGLVAPADAAAWWGRVGWRLQADDRLPLAGAVPLPAALQPAGLQLDQARWLARWPGLFIASALGARGITLAPLLGELLAAQIAGAPLPLEQDLVDALDPGRWAVRAARRSGAAAAGSGLQPPAG